MIPKKAQKSRLCVVTPAHSAAQTGGAEYQIDCLLDVLRQQDRYEIYYLARLVDERFESPDFRIVKIGKNRKSPRFGYATDLWPLYSALRAIRPQAIYQRVACGYTGIAALYATRNNSRMIWHVAHDSDVMRESVIDGRNFIRKMIEKRSIRYGIQHAQHIVTQTAHQAELLRRNYGRSADAVIPNFQPAPRERIDKSGPVRVIWAASLKPWKQPEVFVRLAKALSGLGGVRFVLAGPRPTGAREQPWAEELMRSIETTPNLDYVGGQSQQEINNLLAGGHLFVNTSVQEGFPNTFIQAWMREVPVVSLHVDPDGVLAREDVGILAGSEKSLANAVRALCEDADQRTSMGRHARERAMRIHSLENANAIAHLIDCGKSAAPGFPPVLQ